MIVDFILVGKAIGATIGAILGAAILVAAGLYVHLKHKRGSPKLSPNQISWKITSNVFCTFDACIFT